MGGRLVLHTKAFVVLYESASRSSSCHSREDETGEQIFFFGSNRRVTVVPGPFRVVESWGLLGPTKLTVKNKNSRRESGETVELCRSYGTDDGTGMFQGWLAWLWFSCEGCDMDGQSNVSWVLD